MTVSRSGLVIASLAALLSAGCQSSRMGSMDTSQPAPLEAAPTAPVASNALPPPASPPPSQFPAAPADTQVASLPPSEPANAPDLTASKIAGVWNTSVGGQSCRVATPQTKFGQGFRAGPLRCPAPIDGVKSWNVAGKQLTLYDDNGGALAKLYASGADKFDGQTTSGLPISLSR